MKTKIIFLLAALLLLGCNWPPREYRKILHNWELVYVGVNGVDKTYLLDSLFPGNDGFEYEFFRVDENTDKSYSYWARYRFYTFNAYKMMYRFYFIDENQNGNGEEETASGLYCDRIFYYGVWLNDTVSLPFLGMVSANLDSAFNNMGRDNVPETWNISKFKGKNLNIDITYNGNFIENRFIKVKD